jgi:acetoin utilization protein AcuB
LEKLAMPKTIAQLMTANPISITLDDDLSRVKMLFEQHGFHHLLVVEDKKLFGVVSDRDLLKAISPNIGKASETAKDSATLNKPAHQIMTRKPIIVQDQDSIQKAIRLFNEHKISCLPVVDEEGKTVGILSWRDIFKALDK